MKLKLISLISILTLILLHSACSSRELGPVFHNSIPIAINDTKEMRQRDSLVNVITTTTFEKPSDLKSATLIIELYTYHEFINSYSTKFYKELPSLYRRLHYPRYKKWAHKHLFNQYTGKKILKKSKKYSQLNSDTHRYVIKTTIRTILEVDSTNNAILNSIVYYLFDRKSNKVLGEIKDPSGAILNGDI